MLPHLSRDVLFQIGLVGLREQKFCIWHVNGVDMWRVAEQAFRVTPLESKWRSPFVSVSCILLFPSSVKEVRRLCNRFLGWL